MRSRTSSRLVFSVRADTLHTFDKQLCELTKEKHGINDIRGKLRPTCLSDHRRDDIILDKMTSITKDLHLSSHVPDLLDFIGNIETIE